MYVCHYLTLMKILADKLNKVLTSSLDGKKKFSASSLTDPHNTSYTSAYSCFDRGCPSTSIKFDGTVTPIDAVMYPTGNQVNVSTKLTLFSIYKTPTVLQDH